MKVLDLFSGIGGFSLGLEWAGMEPVAFCEIEPFCCAVLKKHWPDVPIYEDIRELTRKAYEARGGYYQTLFAEDSLAREKAEPGGEKAKVITAGSGRKCSVLLKSSGPAGSLVRTLLTMPIWGSGSSRLIWKASVTKYGHLLFRLVPVGYRHWNSTSGLLPRILSSEHKGVRKIDYRTSKGKGRHFPMTTSLREKDTDGYCPHPDFVELVKGFPAGWTALKPSEMLSSRKSSMKLARR